MHPYLENRLKESVESLKDQENFSQKQAEIIKSLPEKERLEIYKAMFSHKKENSSFKIWADLNHNWKIFIKAMALVVLFLSIVFLGLENGWKTFKEILRDLYLVF